MKRMLTILLSILIYTNSNCQDIYKIISVSSATGDIQKNEWNWSKFSNATGTIAFKDGVVIITSGIRVIYLRIEKLISSESEGAALAVTWDATDQDNQLVLIKKVVDPKAKCDSYGIYYNNIAVCWLTEHKKIKY